MDIPIFDTSVLTQTIIRFHQWDASHPSWSAWLLRHWGMQLWLYMKVIKSGVSFLSYASCAGYNERQ